MVAPRSSEGTGQHILFFVRVHQTRMMYQHLLAIWQAADSLGYDGASLYDLLAAPCLPRFAGSCLSAAFCGCGPSCFSLWGALARLC